MSLRVDTVHMHAYCLQRDGRHSVHGYKHIYYTVSHKSSHVITTERGFTWFPGKNGDNLSDAGGNHACICQHSVSNLGQAVNVLRLMRERKSKQQNE